MARRKKSKDKGRKGGWVDPDTSINNPFGSLANLTPTTPNTDPPADVPKPTPPKKTYAASRAVVRMERKGRGGKTVTVITHLGLPADIMKQWCKKLRQKLGCGGQVEGENLVFNGDHRDRLPTVLEKMGVKKVTRG